MTRRLRRLSSSTSAETTQTNVESVAYGTTNLVRGTDYTVEYANNVNSTVDGDPATATLTGIGLYKGSTNVTFQIDKREIVLVVEDDPIIYDGQSHTNEFRVLAYVPGTDPLEPGFATEADEAKFNNAIRYTFSNPCIDVGQYVGRLNIKMADIIALYDNYEFEDFPSAVITIDPREVVLT